MTKHAHIVYEMAARNALFESSSVVVADMNTGEILCISKPAEDMFGYKADELIGKSVDLLLPPASREGHAKFRALFAVSPRTRAMGSGMVLRGYRKDSTEFLIQVGLVKADAMGQGIVVASIMDLTEPVKTARLVQAVAGTT